MNINLRCGQNRPTLKLTSPEAVRHDWRHSLVVPETITVAANVPGLPPFSLAEKDVICIEMEELLVKYYRWIGRYEVVRNEYHL